MIHLFLAVLAAGLIFWVCIWAIDYIGIPEPFNKILKVIVVVFAVLIVVNAVLDLTGQPAMVRF
jgi:hypothetical protein